MLIDAGPRSNEKDIISYLDKLNHCLLILDKFFKNDKK